VTASVWRIENFCRALASPRRPLAPRGDATGLDDLRAQLQRWAVVVDPLAAAEVILPTLPVGGYHHLYMKTTDPRELLDDTFSYREAREAGLSDTRIYGLRDAGAILALGGGIYRWAEAPPADLDLIDLRR
jgi:hypothetical protein